MRIEKFDMDGVLIHRQGSDSCCHDLPKALEIMGKNVDKLTEFRFLLKEPGTNKDPVLAVKFSKRIDGTFDVEILRSQNIYQ